MITAGILAYGNANSGSVAAALRRVGAAASVVRTAADIHDVDLLVLPGVGHAARAMEHLAEPGLRAAVEGHHAAGRPILGICLGAQLMFERLEEADGPGLGWLPGDVRALPGSPGHHTGWSRLETDGLAAVGLGRAITTSDTFYFNHRYAIGPGEGVTSIAATGAPITAVVAHEHLVGLQFHPEKSQAQGDRLLRNLMEDRYGL